MTKANALLIYTLGDAERLSNSVAQKARSMAERCLEIAKAAEDPSSGLNTLGELQASAIMLDVEIGSLARLRDLLYRAESASDEL